MTRIQWNILPVVLALAIGGLASTVYAQDMVPSIGSNAVWDEPMSRAPQLLRELLTAHEEALSGEIHPEVVWIAGPEAALGPWVRSRARDWLARSDAQRARLELLAEECSADPRLQLVYAIVREHVLNVHRRILADLLGVTLAAREPELARRIETTFAMIEAERISLLERIAQTSPAVASWASYWIDGSARQRDALRARPSTLSIRAACASATGSTWQERALAAGCAAQLN